MTDAAQPQWIVLEGGSLDGQERHHAAPLPITSKAGERYEMLTDPQGNPERDIFGRLRYRVVR